MTVASTATLHYDLRFRGAPLELRGLYRMLLDYQDAAGDVVARGVDGVGATAAALGCAREEAAAVLARLAAHGLVRHETDRVCLLVGSRRGKRGGMSGAERARKLRAEGVAPRNEKVTSQTAVTTEETGNRNGIAAAPTAPAAEPRNGNVTSELRETTAETAERNRQSVSNVAPAAAPAVLPPSAPRVLPLPHPPPLTPPASAPPAPAGGVGAVAPTAGVVQGSLFGEVEPAPSAPKPKAPKPRPANAPPPLPFKLGEALDQLAAASAGRFVRGEGRDITQSVAIAITAQIRAYPTLAEWEVCGAWLAAGALAFRGALAPSWVASTDFRNAMALARDWDAKGRPPVDRRDAVDGAKRAAANDPQRTRSPPPARRRVGPAAVSTADDFRRDAEGPDPLLSLLETAT